jgi:hypothetical protein
MKFLPKSENSNVLQTGLIYKKGQSKNNANLLTVLLEEQKGFCAYTEEVLLENSLCPEVEHFDPAKKYADDYYNYYVVSKYANKRKMKLDRSGFFSKALFYDSLFFQNLETLKNRVGYGEGIYYEIDAADMEAAGFIEYIGLNDPFIKKKRDNAIRRIRRDIAENATQEEIISYFKQELAESRETISFITAIEQEFNINLSDIIND